MNEVIKEAICNLIAKDRKLHLWIEALCENDIEISASLDNANIVLDLLQVPGDLTVICESDGNEKYFGRGMYWELYWEFIIQENEPTKKDIETFVDELASIQSGMASMQSGTISEEEFKLKYKNINIQHD